jgi:predicted membrane channel-forming protein YqfA (hemolysin III family)
LPESEPPTPGRPTPQPPAPEPRGQDRVIALFVAVSWGAVVFAVDGLLSVILDRDPIGGSVTPYYGILALLLAGLLLWAVLAGSSRSRGPWFGTLAAAAGVYLLLVASALPVGLVLAAEQAGSPFVLAAALMAGVTVFVTWTVLRRMRLRVDR